MAIPKVMGTEIEYGITVKGDPDFDPISSCVLLVNAYREDHAGEILWDYDQENPLADARGFQVEGEKYTPNQQENIARNKTLINGARYYVDHAHPEYSCPEVTNARDLVIHEKAGERIIEASRREANALLPAGAQMLIYKNNSDRKGNSYGSHENYLMDRRDVLQADRRAPDAVPRHAPGLRRRGQGGQREPRASLRLPALPARGLLRDRGRARHDGQAPDHQHARRAARGPREVPPPAHDRRRREPLRVHDLSAHRRHHAGAGDDRGRRDPQEPLAARSGASDQGVLPRSDLPEGAAARERQEADRGPDPGRVPGDGAPVRRLAVGRPGDEGRADALAARDRGASDAIRWSCASRSTG